MVDTFFAADVETDGPVPGSFSMLSLGLVVAGTFDGRSFRPATGRERSFAAELRPISDRFDPEALRVSGLSRERLAAEGRDPREAMTALAAWVAAEAGETTPVLCAYPLGFDWSFLTYYFYEFAKKSPFSYSRGFCVKTAVSLRTEVPIGEAGRGKLPPHLRPSLPHTHAAIDDARSLAELIARLFAAHHGASS